MNLPAGGGLLLTGSGIYWILSSQLIASFTVLTPEIFRGTTTGTTLVLVTGIFVSVAGLWTINVDFAELSALIERRDGWIFVIPLVLVTLDLCLTVAGLTRGTGIVELNPFVSAALQGETAVLTGFVVAYMALSEGVALLAISAGRFLFGTKPERFLPYAIICGAASFGLFSNLLLLTGLGGVWSAALAGAAGAPVLAAWIYRNLRSSSDSEIVTSRPD